jgi:hypothetical protein
MLTLVAEVILIAGKTRFSGFIQIMMTNRFLLSIITENESGANETRRD